MKNTPRLLAIAASLLACTNITAQVQKNDSVQAKGEGSNRNMLLNAASASQPRQISLGLPISGNAYIYEDGLPVSYYNYQLYPYKSWHSGVSHESTSTMSPSDMVMKYGVISYSVDSKSRLTGDSFEGRVNYTLNQFGRQAVDANIATPIGGGWGFSVGTYQNFDPGSNQLAMSYLKERTQFYKGSLSKTFADGRGKMGLTYQYSRFMNLTENYGPFVFVGDGSVKEYNGFKLGYDQYLPTNNTIKFLDVYTGQMMAMNINNANTDKIHNVNFTLDYQWDNGTKLSVNSKLKHGHSYRANPSVMGMTNAEAGGGFTYEDGTEFVGRAQTRRQLYFDAFEHSWMTNAQLSGYSRNKRHHWTAEVDYWLNHGGTKTSAYMFAHEVKADPKLLLYNGQEGYSYNSYAEYYNGHEHKVFGFIADEWTVNNRLWLKAGLRLEYLNVNGDAANDVTEANRRRAGFNLKEPGVIINHFNKNNFNNAYILSGRFELLRGFGLQAEYMSTTLHSQIFNYGTYNTPSQKGITSNYLRGGIYWKNNWIDLTSQITWIRQNNEQLRATFDHVLTKDAGGMKAGQNETVYPVVYYDQAALGWTTDAVITPVSGLSIHALVTFRNPQYKNFDVSPTFSDGVTEVHSFTNNTLTGISKLEMEIEPSYRFDKWRVWLSARYYSRQYINKTNSLYFNGRWETFGGVDYTLNRHVRFSANVVNILNQKGASGSIGSADLVTDPTPYKNYVMAGTFIRPFTVELTTSINF
ncbi:MAG: 2,6-beta-D-fructofuranosidase [Bacteroidaceae bacterium]|nr:2,6-beta-D-fructofuranosidase [Bacteroidaceae bacterium]